MVQKIKIKYEGIDYLNFNLSTLPSQLIGDEMRAIYMTGLLINYAKFLIDKETRDYELP